MSAQTRRGDVLIPLLTVLSDTVTIEASFLAAYWLRFVSPTFNWIGFGVEDTPPISGYLLGSVFVIALWLLLFSGRSMYGARRAVDLTDELTNVAQSISIGMLVVMSAAFFYRGFSYSRVVFALLWVLAIILVFLGRAAVLGLERRYYRRGKHLQQAILIGSDLLADQVYSRLNGHPSFGFSIVGYFAPRKAARALTISRAPYLGPVEKAPEYIRRSRTELCFIALRSKDHPSLFTLISECEGVNIDFLMVPDVMEVLTSQVRLKELEGVPFLKIKSVPFTAWGRISKRAFDIVVAGTILLVCSPLMLVIGVLIILDSHGSILFRQPRVGLDGKEFTMLKFRSMKEGSERFDAEAGLGVYRDPRRTRIGALLRKTSLDELPQLINVLKGEMSLVGPRPERVTYVREFQRVVPKYVDRHRVKTGVTGWAQVNGLRGNTSIKERIRYDLYYIENWSIAFDIKILLRTLRAALSFKGVD